MESKTKEKISNHQLETYKLIMEKRKDTAAADNE